MTPLTTDTLAVDTARIAALQRNPDYAYAVGAERESLWDVLMRKLGEWFSSASGTATDAVFDSRVAWWLFFIVAFCLLLWLLSRRWDFLFGSQRRHGGALDGDEADIHDMDFDTAIAQAEADRDYTRAARLAYLQTLKSLADDGRLDWQPFKTPTQYAQEYDSAAFRKMTQTFLRVRYGNFEADRACYDEMRRWQQAVEKGGGA